jgi:hypothetical protein
MFARFHLTFLLSGNCRQTPGIDRRVIFLSLKVTTVFGNTCINLCLDCLFDVNKLRSVPTCNWSISVESDRYGMTCCSSAKQEIKPPSRFGVSLLLHSAINSLMWGIYWKRINCSPYNPETPSSAPNQAVLATYLQYWSSTREPWRRSGPQARNSRPLKSTRPL